MVKMTTEILKPVESLHYISDKVITLNIYECFLWCQPPVFTSNAQFTQSEYLKQHVKQITYIINEQISTPVIVHGPAIQHMTHVWNKITFNNNWERS